jgi:hypothetical protein
MAGEMTLEHFAALQGQHFTVHLDEGVGLPAELVEARGLPAPPFQGRQPFTLLFRGPAAPRLPQRTYPLQHAGDPAPMDIFLVPISVDATGVCYEAVFT